MAGETTERYRSLDGLRGVAASTVVVYHALLIVPSVSVLYIEHSNPSPFTPAWWLYRTPLRIIMPGHEAVLVFFVLSGFVLTLPLTRQHMSVRKTLSYYCRRLLRLYIPVWLAIGFSLSLALLVPRDEHDGSSWLATHSQPTQSGIVRDLQLLFGTTNLDSPLWSLTWEMWYSLLLPLIFIIVRIIRFDRWWILGIVFLAVTSSVAQFKTVHDALPCAFLATGLLEYMPVFVIGMLFALQRQNLAELGKRVSHWPLITVAAILLLLSPTLFIKNSPVFRVGDAVLTLACLVGVSMVVFVTLEAPLARAVLESRIPQWLGSRSFSMYLIHEPIIVSAALMTAANGWMPWLLVVVAVIPVVLLTTEVFYRIAEHPAHLLARFVGKAVAGPKPTQPNVSKVPRATSPAPFKE